jgi:hypothetical protein
VCSEVQLFGMIVTKSKIATLDLEVIENNLNSQETIDCWKIWERHFIHYNPIFLMLMNRATERHHT